VKNSITLSLLTDTPSHHARVQRVFEQAPAYVLRTEGKLPGPDDGAEAFSSLAPGGTAEQKSIWMIREGEFDVGVIDIYRGWNAPHKIMIGLLLVIESAQGRGLGKTAYALLRDTLIAESNAYSVLRIGVIETNVAAFPFWRKLGFMETGEVKSSDEFIAPVVILERSLL
jgi:ribosomal protein S18 acetylase RimI-like enzyme